MRLLNLLLLLLSVGALGCQKTAPVESGAQAASEAKAATPEQGVNGASVETNPRLPLPTLTQDQTRALDLFQWAGGRHAAVLLVWPARWQAGVKVFRPMLAGMDVPERALDLILNASDPLEFLLITLGGMTFGYKEVLKHRDLTRPLLVALAATDPLFDHPIQHALRLLRVPKTDIPGISHRILLPATSAKELADELSALLVSWNLEPQAACAGAKQLKGGHLFGLPGGGVVALIPETDLVRVEVIHNGFSLPETEQASCSPVLLAQIDYQPSARALSPALFQVLSDQASVSALIRPKYVPALSSQAGASMVCSALAQVEPEYRTRLLRTGVSEVLQGALVMDTSLSAFGEMGLSLVLADPISLTAVVEPTPHGLKLLAASMGRRPVPAVLPAKTVAWVASGLDFASLLKAATVPVGLQAPKGAAVTPALVADAFQECGFGCYAYLATGGWPGVAAAFLQGDPSAPSHWNLIPTALWLGLTENVVPFGLAGALRFAKGSDVSPFSALLTNLASKSSGPVDMGPVAREEGTWLLASWNQRTDANVLPAPKQGDATVDPDAPTHAAWLDLAALRFMLAKAEPQAQQHLPSLKCLSVNSWNTGALLLTHATLGIAAQCPAMEKAPAMPQLPLSADTLAPATWNECEGALASETMRALKGLSRADIESFETIRTAWMAALAGHKQCLTDHPDLNAAVVELTDLMKAP